MKEYTKYTIFRHIIYWILKTKNIWLLTPLSIFDNFDTHRTYQDGKLIRTIKVKFFTDSFIGLTKKQKP